MRELKFRAWDKLDNRMYEVLSIYFETDCLLRSDGMESTFNESILMQYTGLKDNQDVEIYEGDIVYLEDWNAHIPERFNVPLHETRKVTFKDGTFCLQCLQDDAHCSISYANMDFTEVIGNIHETKELLDEVQAK